MTVIIQIIISVVVVYLIFSVIVYVIVEWISGLLQLRGKTLRNAIYKLFSDRRLGELIYQHPQVEKLKSDRKLPSYIPANNVAVALIDLVKAENPASEPLAGEEEVYRRYKRGLLNLPQGELKTLLASVTDHTEDLKTLTDSIEKWYNNYMDRVTGWYKKNIRLVVLAVAAVVTLAFNVDSIHLIKIATTDPKTRERLNLLADQVIRDSLVNNLVTQQIHNPDYFEEYVNDSSIHEEASAEPVLDEDSVYQANTEGRLDQLRQLSSMVHQWELPVGWEIKKTHSWLFILIGWILSVLALSVGAPFWFDLLKRLVNVRNAGVKPGAPISDKK